MRIEQDKPKNLSRKEAILQGIKEDKDRRIQDE
jgi:hypothetical protein